MSEEEKQAQEAAAKAAEGNEEAGKKGGPSDEFKAKRLEEENQKLKDRLDRLESKVIGEDEGEEDDSLEDLYRERETDKVITEVSTEISKLPKVIQDKIKSDPFNKAWFDERDFKYESIGLKVENPKVKYSVASRVAVKSIKKFTEDYLTENGTQKKEDDNTISVNPPADKTTGNPDATVDLWQLSDEELLARKAAILAQKKK